MSEDQVIIPGSSDAAVYAPLPGRPESPHSAGLAVPAAYDLPADKPLREGRTYAVWFPFKRETYFELTGDGSTESPTWVPGWRYEYRARYLGHGEYTDETDAEWDGDGQLWLTVVSIHKPGPSYPTRVFYTRQWVSPEGRVFGKRGLRMVSEPAFRRWLAGGKTEHLAEARALQNAQPTEAARERSEHSTAVTQLREDQ